MRRLVDSLKSWWHRPVRTVRRHLQVQWLEGRLAPSVAAEEQLFVYMLNRARHDPKAYQLEQGLSVNLSGVAAQAPLAVNDHLFDSTEFHANDMATRNYFGHTNPDGLTPNQMVRNANYALNGIFSAVGNEVESIAAGTIINTAAAALNLLIVDSGLNPPGHRIHLLAMDPFFVAHREIGVGHEFSATSTYTNYWSIHTAYSAVTDKFLTGVVFNDANGNGRYDVNEGLAGVTVSIGATSVQTNAQGGWSIPVSGTPTVTVTASGGGYSGTGSAQVSVGLVNREVDLISGNSAGIVDFSGNANHAPVLNAGSSPLPSVNVNSSPVGITVDNLIGGSITDADSGDAKGIAIIGLTGATTGAWQFSMNGGANWTNFGSPSASAARLLDAADMVRFLPNTNYTLTSSAVATPSLTFRAWDETSGTAGLTAAISTTGGSTAYSATSCVASIVVNDAPILAAGSPALPTVKEDSAPLGVTVAVLAGTMLTDAGAGAVKGIAVTGADNSNGSWQYSTGGAWLNFGAATDGSARLLRDTDKVRFLPAANYNGTATISFRGWDRTTGAFGQTADASVNGGTNAFSTNAVTAGITVTPVNDAPVLAAGSPLLPPVLTGDGNPAGITVADLADASISDVDTGALKGIAVVGITGTTSGTWEYSTNGGANWTKFGVPSGAAARLLADDALVRFRPNPTFTLVNALSVLPSLTFRAWDRTTGTAGLTAYIAATGGATAYSTMTQLAKVRVNAAPVLTPASPILGPVASNKSFTITIAALLGGSVTDVGTGALKGLAVTDATTTAGGKWQYSIDGVTFKDLGTPTAGTARMLRATDRLRYIPLAGNTGPATLTFHAWDQTTGSAGQLADLSLANTSGGTTAFSLATDVASLTVN